MAHSEDVESLRRLAGLATPMAIRVAVTLGLPDRLRGAALPVRELAVDTVAGLLLGHLEAIGIVAGSGAGYRTTAYGANLCEDAGNGNPPSSGYGTTRARESVT